MFIALSACDSHLSDYYRKEANKLEKQKKYTEAILKLNIAIEKDPKNIDALIDRGVDKSFLKNYEGAIKDYSDVIRIDKKNTLAFFNRARNKTRLSNYRGAITDLNAAIATKGGESFWIDKEEIPGVNNGFEYDCSMEEILFERGIAYYNIDSFKKSFRDLSFTIERSAFLPESYFYRGTIYLMYKNKDSACQDLYKAKGLGYTEAQELIDKYCK